MANKTKCRNTLKQTVLAVCGSHVDWIKAETGHNPFLALTRQLVPRASNTIYICNQPATCCGGLRNHIRPRPGVESTSRQGDGDGVGDGIGLKALPIQFVCLTIARDLWQRVRVGVN